MDFWREWLKMNTAYFAKTKTVTGAKKAAKQTVNLVMVIWIWASQILMVVAVATLVGYLVWLGAIAYDNQKLALQRECEKLPSDYSPSFRNGQCYIVIHDDLLNDTVSMTWDDYRALFAKN